MTPEERFDRIDGILLRVAEGLERLTGLHAKTEEKLAAYIEAGNERMKQMEANLDALIRVITADHSNGKGKL